MAALIQAVRGMNDFLPSHTAYWQWLEQTLASLLTSYGYQEIRFPIVEKTELFKRSIGDVTDIVEKEMYSFVDRNNDQLTLRPEGTAVCVRAGIEHGLLYNQIQRFWYLGPMFRHERPQKGRYRQFHQFGVEAFGIAGPEIDAEIIAITARLWKKLGLNPDQLSLQINSLGSQAARTKYRLVLIEYFNGYLNLLDEASKHRLQKNPLRLLDSKNPELTDIISQAPQLLDYLDSESKAHFDKLCELLTTLNIPYQINPRLVRGLDYYNRTVFEWVTEQLGTQGTICAGGHYDSLVEQLGGKTTPAVGFAIGLERLIALAETINPNLTGNNLSDIYIISNSLSAGSLPLVIAETIHQQLPKLRLVTDCSEANIKTQFKRADTSGAKLALVVDSSHQTIQIKYLRESTEPRTISGIDVNRLLELLAQYFNLSLCPGEQP